MRRVITSLAVMILLAGIAFGTQRDDLTKINWLYDLPPVKKGGPPPKPVFLYVTSDEPTNDEKRFEDVALKNEKFLLATKFFDAVQISETKARKLELLKGVNFRAPALIAFDSSRTKRSIAGGRASGMSLYETLVKVGQVDYETNIPKTVWHARTLLGTFDQIDAARDALGVKRGRVADARSRGDTKMAALLQREIDKKAAEIDKMQEEAMTRWNKIWDLKRKDRSKKKKKAKR